ncbi:MAG: mechanosensitive ion channel family protein [Tissierellia bacterium]|nr:mechanosensitive ion channel family protein [Tissierellia bacterium]
MNNKDYSIEELKEMLALAEENKDISFLKSIDWTAIAKKFFLVLLVLFIGIQIINLIRRFVRKFLEQNESTRGIRYLIDIIVKFTLYIVLVLIIFSILGIRSTSIVALVGSLGIGVGLALQGSLSDLAAGILIVLLRPFQYGDHIYLDSMDSPRLTVKQIRFFQTRFLTAQNYDVIIPNRELMSSKIYNLSMEEKIQIEISIDISYDANIKEARRAIENVFEDEGRILSDQDYHVFVSELGDSGITLKARAYVKPEDHLPVTVRMNEKIKEAFDRQNIEIPFPQMDVFIKDPKGQKTAMGEIKS